MLLRNLSCKEITVNKDIFGDEYISVLTSTQALAKSVFVKEIEKEMNISFIDMVNVIKLVNHWRGDLPVKILSNDVHIGEYEDCCIHTWWINSEYFSEMEAHSFRVKGLKKAIRKVKDEPIEIGENEFRKFIEVISTFGVKLHEKIQNSKELFIGGEC